MRRVKASVYLLACTVMCAAVMLALPAVRMSSVATEIPAQVTLTEVTRGDIRQVIAAAGAVRYEQEYAAVCPAAGMVAQVYVQPGDTVTAGQALVRLDASAEEAVLASAYGTDGLGASLPEGIGLEGMTAAAISDAQARMEAMTLRAAADGRVAEVLMSQYSGVAAGTAAVLLSGERQRIVCPVVVRDAQQLQPGMEAIIYVDGAEACSAYVQQIGAARTDTAAGQIVCDITLTPEENLTLPLGAPVEAEIILLRCENVTTVPVTALDADGCLWVADQGRCWRIKAEIICRDEMHCWVSLPEGTMIIDRPGELLEGQRYKEEKR